MVGYLLLAVYVVGYLWTYRQAYRLFADDLASFGSSFAPSEPEPMDRAMTVGIALIVSMLWPIAILGILLHRFVTPTTAREREADLRRREQRIADLEREAGIR